jgi:hypothetical protein
VSNCKGITQAGKGCRRVAVNGTDFCALHTDKKNKPTKPSKLARDFDPVKSRIKSRKHDPPRLPTGKYMRDFKKYKKIRDAWTVEDCIYAYMLEYELAIEAGIAKDAQHWGKMLLDALRILEARKETMLAQRIVLEGSLDSHLPMPKMLAAAIDVSSSDSTN